MHAHWCVLIEISMEIGMLNFWMGLLANALMKETFIENISRTINPTFFFEVISKTLSLPDLFNNNDKIKSG